MTTVTARESIVGTVCHTAEHFLDIGVRIYIYMDIHITICMLRRSPLTQEVVERGIPEQAGRNIGGRGGERGKQ